jgi:hypothetical protein
MNPDKLFDYLDGKLSAAERAALEESLVSDSQLQRELEIARRIHASMRDSREVLETLEPRSATNRGAVLGRRIAIAFAVLVFLNVLFGLYAIVFMEKKRRIRPLEQQKQQLVEALQKAGASALPTPSLDISEIKLNAPTAEHNRLADKVIAAAKQCGGSAVKGLADENGILLFAEVPAPRENDFREILRQLGAPPSKARDEGAMTGKAIVQIRIIEKAQP